jgi:hypothetical protein
MSYSTLFWMTSEKWPPICSKQPGCLCKAVRLKDLRAPDDEHKNWVVSDLSTCFWRTQRANSYRGSDLVSPKSVSLVYPFYNEIQPLVLSSCDNTNCPDEQEEWHGNDDLEICLSPSSMLGQYQIHNNYGRMTGPKGGCSKRIILLLHSKNWSLFSSPGIVFITTK